MRKLNGYQEAKTYSDQERLPVGGYILTEPVGQDRR